MLHHYIFRVRSAWVDEYGDAHSVRALDEIVCASEDEARAEMRSRYGEWARIVLLMTQHVVDVSDDVALGHSPKRDN